MDHILRDLSWPASQHKVIRVRTSCISMSLSFQLINIPSYGYTTFWSPSSAERFYTALAAVDFRESQGAWRESSWNAWTKVPRGSPSAAISLTSWWTCLNWFNTANGISSWPQMNCIYLRGLPPPPTLPSSNGKLNLLGFWVSFSPFLSTIPMSGNYLLSFLTLPNLKFWFRCYRNRPWVSSSLSFSILSYLSGSSCSVNLPKVQLCQSQDQMLGMKWKLQDF